MAEPHPHTAHRREQNSADGLVPIGCITADFIRDHHMVTVSSAKTDFDGTYGEPEVYGEWSLSDGTDRVVLREHRWPARPDDTPRALCDPANATVLARSDRYACEHYAPGPTS